MPEGDAVYLTARRLDRALAGRELTASDFRWPSLATVDLAGAQVRGTGTHGKHLLTRVVHGGRELTLHTHLKMEGTWKVLRAGERWPKPGHTARVVLRTATTEAVGFSLGLVELFATSDEPGALERLGPDLLKPDWTESDSALACSRLLADPARPLADALLDQTVVAGIGTIYLAEACFVHRVHPLTPAGEVAEPDRLLRRARSLLQEGVDHRRPTQRVYRRHRYPCPRCGTTIVAGPIGPPGKQRTTYWCPSCQPL